MPTNTTQQTNSTNARLTTPNGTTYEVTGEFRSPRVGESYIGSDQTLPNRSGSYRGRISVGSGIHGSDNLRLIVRKVSNTQAFGGSPAGSTKSYLPVSLEDTSGLSVMPTTLGLQFGQTGTSRHAARATLSKTSAIALAHDILNFYTGNPQ